MSSEHEMDETPLEEVAEDHAGPEGGDEAHAADADFTDEDWNDEGDASEDDQAGDGGDGAAPKKKKMKMNMMIIGAFAVIGLGIVYWQMSNKSVRLPPPAAMQAAVPAAPPTDTDMIYGASTESEQPKADKGKPLKGILDDPNAVRKLQKLSDSHVVSAEELKPEAAAPSLVPKEVRSAPPMPAPISQSGHKPAEGPLTPLPQEASGTPFAKVAAATAGQVTPPKIAQPAPDKAANPAWPSPPAAKTISPAWPAPSAQKPATPPATAPGSDKQGSAAAIPAAANPFTAQGNAAASSVAGESLDRIARKLDEMDSELKALQESSVRKDEMADIKAQLGSLRDKVNNISTQSSGAAAKQAAGKTAHRQHAVRAAALPKRGHKVPVVSSWTLKSAQPGMAIVAQANGQMITVRTGDKLQGLGRIRSIDEEKGRWVVKGAAGILTQ
jgi:hypothetical protein